MARPRLKILKGQTAFAKAFGELTLMGLPTVVSAYSRMVDLTPHDQESLRTYLRTRIAHTRQALGRDSWFGGRIYNQLAGEDPHFVWMAGTHMLQTLALLEIEPPEEVMPSGQYSLDLESTQLALDILSDRMAKQSA
jgi:hypothetical protein